MQAVLASNLELFRAQEMKKKECEELQQDVELKNAQIASLEEARKKDEGDKAFFAFFSSDFFSFSDKYFSRLFFLFVELLNTAQDILKNSTDMQALMNEAADLAGLVTKLKADHAKELDDRALAHAAEVSKLTGQLEAMSNNLDQVNKNAKEQQDQLSKAVQLAQETLENHLDEVNAIHDHVLGMPPVLHFCHLAFLILEAAVCNFVFVQCRLAWEMTWLQRRALPES